MESFKTAVMGMLVLVALFVQTSLACWCAELIPTMKGMYCHRLRDETKTTAFIKAEICAKEPDDGHVEHHMSIQQVYLDPLYLKGTGNSLKPARVQPCATLAKPWQSLLLTSRENRGSACGIPIDLNVGKTYIMEVIYSGGHYDITSCAFHKEVSTLSIKEWQFMDNLRHNKGLPKCIDNLPRPLKSLFSRR